MHCTRSLTPVPPRVLTRSASISRRLLASTKPSFVATAVPIDDEAATQTPVVLSEIQLEDFKTQFLHGNGQYDSGVVGVLEEKVGLPAKDWFPQEEIEQIQKQDFLTPDQFERLCEANLIIEGKLVEYRRAFNAVDTSGNGSIGFNELCDLLHFLDNPLSDARITELMVKYDKDESGQIEFEEFLLMFQEEIFDLKEVLKYTKEVDSQEPAAAPGLIRLKSGEVSKIFTESEFDEILDRNRDRLIVVFAGLTWCRPCRAMTKTYDKAAAAHKNSIFIKFFGNANASTKTLFVQRLKAKATPAFFFFRNKEMVHSYTGNRKEKLADSLATYGDGV